MKSIIIAFVTKSLATAADILNVYICNIAYSEYIMSNEYIM